MLVKCFRLLDVTVCKIAAAQSGNFDHPWCGQVGEAAGKVHVPPFEPRQGVQIETDPKATSVSSAAALGDDERASLTLSSSALRCAAILTHLDNLLTQAPAKLTLKIQYRPLIHMEGQL